MKMQNQFNKMSVSVECQTISENIQKRKQEKFEDISTFKALNFCFQIQGHSRTFKFCTNPENYSQPRDGCIHRGIKLLFKIMV